MQKHIKKIIALSMAAVMALATSACGKTESTTEPVTTGKADQGAVGETTTAASGETAVADDGKPGDSSLPWTGELVLYTSFPQARKEQLVNGFEETYGIKVTLVEGGSSELIARMESEAGNPQGDIMIGGMDTAVYQPNEHLFQEYTSVNNDLFPKEYQVVDGKFAVYSLEPSIIAVNLDLMEEKGFKLDQLDSYEKLLNPDLKGLLCMADPTAAATGYEHLVNMLVDKGKEADDYADGWDYVGQLLDVATVLSSSGNVSSGVSTGEYMAALTYESTICTYIVSGYNVEIIYMDEGTIFGCNAAGIVDGCPNLRSAQLFIDYITSKEFQEIQASDPTYSRSIIAPMPETFPGSDLNDIPNVIAGDPGYFTVNKGSVLDKYLQISQAK